MCNGQNSGSVMLISLLIQVLRVTVEETREEIQVKVVYLEASETGLNAYNLYFLLGINILSFCNIFKLCI